MILIARSLGKEALVETKTKEEIEKTLKTSAKIIGINNRNLSNFEITLNTTKELKKLIPNDKIVVSESGIHTKKDILELDTNAVLIGTSLIEAKNISEKLSAMHRTKTKICGITNQEDAQNAIQTGADILGFNFYKKSPRYITPAQAKEIIRTLPNTVQTAGIFVNSTKEEIKRIEKETGIDFLQIHGEESEKFCARLGTNAIKAVRVKNKIPQNKEMLYARLYDAFDPKTYGGTGKQFDQKKLSKAEGKIFLAGGLNPENIQKALTNLHPYCVDVCSGVESTPGKKDKEKMGNFVVAVRQNEN